MEIKYVTFDIADQAVKCWDAYAWHNFIADTRENLCPDWDDEVMSLEDLMDAAYGDEFWFEEAPRNKTIYAVAFDLASEEFVFCDSDTQIEFVMEMAADADSSEELFWCE